MLANLRPMAIETQDVGVVVGQAVYQTALGEQNGGFGIVEHELQTLGGIAGVERQVGTTRFPDTEQCHEHVGGAIQGNGDETVGLHTETQ